jgi:hypothetical protein
VLLDAHLDLVDLVVQLLRCEAEDVLTVQLERDLRRDRVELAQLIDLEEASPSIRDDLVQ